MGDQSLSPIVEVATTLEMETMMEMVEAQAVEAAQMERTRMEAATQAVEMEMEATTTEGVEVGVLERVRRHLSQWMSLVLSS